MTKKRYSHDSIVIVDHLKEDLIYIDGKDELLELAEYVDRLQEENEQLKQQNKELVKENKDLEAFRYNVFKSMEEARIWREKESKTKKNF